MNKSIFQGLLIAAAVFPAANLQAADLKPETVTAWNAYVQTAQSRMTARLSGGQKFLWADEDPARLQRVRNGAVEVAPVAARGFQSVPGGLIHDWTGSAFVPHASIPEALAILRDYDRYKSFYGPMVVDSRCIENLPDGDRFAMRWVHKAMFVTASMDTEYRSQIARPDDHRAFMIAYTTKIQEIANYGRPDEHLLAPDTGSGFLWRLFSIARYEERDGGVYVEVEAIALTRDIPAAVRGIVQHVVTKMSRNALILSLTQTRQAVLSSKTGPDRDALVTQKKSSAPRSSLSVLP